MSKFKVGDKVTAGNRFDGAWQNLTVIEIKDANLAFATIRAEQNSGVAGLFREDELEFIGLQGLSDQELADKVRVVRAEFVEHFNELTKRGYTVHKANGGGVFLPSAESIGRITKQTTVEL